MSQPQIFLIGLWTLEYSCEAPFGLGSTSSAQVTGRTLVALILYFHCHISYIRSMCDISMNFSKVDHTGFSCRDADALLGWQSHVTLPPTAQTSSHVCRMFAVLTTAEC